MRATAAASALRALHRLRDRYGGDAANVKLARLLLLERARLRSAGAVRGLHETLCFLRAYPDSAGVLRQVDRMLERFDRRPDLRRFAGALAHSGIAGTTAWFPYFWPTARWLATRWPSLLRFDRADTIAQTALEHWLPRLATALEGDALREAKLPGFAALDALGARGALRLGAQRAPGSRGSRAGAPARRTSAAALRSGDAARLIRLIDAFTPSDREREAIYDAINPSCELLPGRGTPSRTQTRWRDAPVAFRAGALRRDRPDVRAEANRPPRLLERLTERRGAEVVDVARAALAVRQRDLDAFAHGNPRDVWIAVDDLGLSFALVGVQPARRSPIYASYGLLTLQNGVPIGYGQADVAGRLAALSFNSFETFRGGETAMVFARFVAALRALFGIDTVSLDGYQLGHENEEAISSGAWWFYAKLGFAPRSARALQLLRAERRRMKAKPGYRSGPDTLRELAKSPLFFDVDPARPAPLPDLAGLGLRAAATIARRAATAGGDRQAAIEALADETLELCHSGARGAANRQPAAANGRSPRRPGDPRTGWSAAERTAWRQWSPLLASLPLSRWPADDRARLIDVVRAKAAASELGYALGLAGHARLARALFDDRFVRERVSDHSRQHARARVRDHVEEHVREHVREPAREHNRRSP